MTTDGWVTIGSVRPDALVEAVLDVHWAVQVIAAAGQTFVEPQPDDSHRAMRWDRGLRCFVGAPFAGVYPFRVGVRPDDLTLVLLDGADGTLGALPLVGQTTEQAHEWLALGLATYLSSFPPIIERPLYDMPTHPVGDGRPYASGRDADHRVVSALYDSAASELEALAATRDDASPVRCWPHHFDIATLLTLERDTTGKATRTVGVGMAPRGSGYDAWYWYVTPWPYPAADALPKIDGPVTWHTEGWTGAVLPGRVVADAPATERQDLVRRFLHGGIDAAMRALGVS